MGILDKIRMLGGNEKPRYSFELINNSLLREDRNKIAELITRVDAGQSPEEKMGPWTELTNFVSERFADVKVSTDEESIANFIKTFAQLPHKLPSSEVAPTAAIESAQPVAEDVTEINSASVVVPTRVTRPNQFDGLEPIAPAVTITPEIIAAQQRGLGITATPEQRSGDGDAAMERLIAEAQTTPVTKAPVLFVSPYAMDKPDHVAKNDSVPGGANIDWITPDHQSTVHEKPPEHLIK